jgi:hypothetical protein
MKKWYGDFVAALGPVLAISIVGTAAICLIDIYKGHTERLSPFGYTIYRMVYNIGAATACAMIVASVISPLRWICALFGVDLESKKSK